VYVYKLTVSQVRLLAQRLHWALRLEQNWIHPLEMSLEQSSASLRRPQTYQSLLLLTPV
jgi:hypothetical protein